MSNILEVHVASETIHIALRIAVSSLFIGLIKEKMQEINSMYTVYISAESQPGDSFYTFRIFDISVDSEK